MKEAREREFAAYMRTLTPEDIKRENTFRAAQRKAGKSRKSNIKDPNAPKKPLSAYFMFLQRIRANPHMVQEIFGDETETTRQSVLAAAKWRSMTDDERKVCSVCLFRLGNSHSTVSFVSHTLPRPSKRRWNTKLREGCTRKARLVLGPASISASSPEALHSGRSKLSRRARVRGWRVMMFSRGT